MSVPKLIFCKTFENVPVTFSQMNVETLELKLKHKSGGCSEDFTKLLKTFCYQTVILMSLGLLVVPLSFFCFPSSCANILV
jgi:hypothetical protein